MRTGRSGSVRLLSALLKAVIFTVVAGGALLLICAFLGSSDGSASMTYRHVTYNTSVRKNGDIHVVQKLTVQLDDNDDSWRQLFQRYSTDQIKGGITDISVSDENGTKYKEVTPILPSTADDEGIDWDRSMAGTWYKNDHPADAKDGTVEIGWNIPTTTSADSLTFTIAMTFQGAVTQHPDVTEFQWEPISTDNEVPVEYAEGTVSFPKGITADTSWAWLHYESTSTTQRLSDGSLYFTATNIAPGNYLDVRAMFDSSVMTGSADTDSNAKDTILAEETAKETEWEEKVRRNASIRLTVWIVTALVLIVLAAYNLYCAWRTHRASQYHGNLDYWREPPAMSPAAAAHLLDVMEPSSDTEKNALSATILSLASKKVIALLPGSRQRYKALSSTLSYPSMTSATLYAAATGPELSSAQDPHPDTTTIALLPAARKDPAELHLSSSEASALRALKEMSKAAAPDSDTERGEMPLFDLNEIKKLLKKNQTQAERAASELTQTKDNSEQEFTALRAVSRVPSLHSVPVTILIIASGLAIGYFALTGQILLALLLGGIGMLIGFFCKNWGSEHVLNHHGQELAGTVLGLRNYLLDFSTFQDRGVFDLALWDRYLVYAAAFGISQEAIKQLAIAQPAVADQQWLDTNAMAYPIIYSFYRPFAFAGVGGATGQQPFSGFGNGFNITNIGGQLASNLGDIQSTITSATSSGSSSGGSFSGGGGFGGGGGGFGGGSFGGR